MVLTAKFVNPPFLHNACVMEQHRHGTCLNEINLRLLRARFSGRRAKCSVDGGEAMKLKKRGWKGNERH